MLWYWRNLNQSSCDRGSCLTPIICLPFVLRVDSNPRPSWSETHELPLLYTSAYILVQEIRTHDILIGKSGTIDQTRLLYSRK
jgi:hypothetical protein